MSRPSDRRLEPRFASNARGVLVAPGFEMTCVIVDVSGSGMKVRLDRALNTPSAVVVVDVLAATAVEADVMWSKGQDIGLRQRGQSSLRGLVPARLAAARAAWQRAGGR
jgi:hypothetical protein